jgi:glycosyltransferase involved in cell wall biosynthesis
LLNSDTKVTAGFVQRLRLTAYSNTKVATVTPLSNNAGVFSVPCPGENEVPAQFGLTRFARAVAQAAVSLPISVPTGHGFCMYIRRDALDETGLFDANAFPRGYGEENDFCRRSAALGWQHLVDCRTYIYHQGSASFSTDKQALLKAGKAILDQRYPDYAELVQKSFGGLPIRHLRQQIAMLARIPAPNAIHIKPRVLYVISSLMGGTPQTNQDLMLALAAEYECFVLHCDSKELTLRHYAEGIYMEIATHTLHAPIQALPHKSDEYDQVVAHWLMQWSIELVHIRHIAWHSLGLLPVIKSLGIILINSFHDFYTLCPNVKLLDNTQQYCAAKCTQSQGDCSHELWPKDAFFSLKNNQVHQWQQMFAETLQYCDAFVTTNQSTKALFLQRYPGLSNKPFTVIEHGRDFTHFEKLSVKPEPGETLRLLCPGNIGDAKGLQLILQLANRRQDVEIHILGIVTEDVALPANVVIHGSYVREQFFSRVAQIKPHCGAVLSIWPETWCHTLTEMWAAGIPVIAVDIGAVGERIRQHSTGWLMYQNTVECLEETIDLARSSPDWEKKFQAVMDWQTHEGAGQTCSAMATYYAQLYKTFLS